MKKGNGVWLSIGFLSERRLAVSFEGVRDYCHICYSFLLWPRRSRSSYPLRLHLMTLLGIRA